MGSCLNCLCPTDATTSQLIEDYKREADARADILNDLNRIVVDKTKVSEVSKLTFELQKQTTKVEKAEHALKAHKLSLDGSIFSGTSGTAITITMKLLVVALLIGNVVFSIWYAVANNKSNVRMPSGPLVGNCIVSGGITIQQGISLYKDAHDKQSDKIEDGLNYVALKKEVKADVENIIQEKLTQFYLSLEKLLKATKESGETATAFNECCKIVPLIPQDGPLSPKPAALAKGIIDRLPPDNETVKLYDTAAGNSAPEARMAKNKERIEKKTSIERRPSLIDTEADGAGRLESMGSTPRPGLVAASAAKIAKAEASTMERISSISDEEQELALEVAKYRNAAELEKRLGFQVSHFIKDDGTTFDRHFRVVNEESASKILRAAAPRAFAMKDGKKAEEV